MNRNVSFLFAIWAALLVGACNSNNPPAPAAPDPLKSNAPENTPAPPMTDESDQPKVPPATTQTADAERYLGPPVAVNIKQSDEAPPSSTATIQVTAPTGGWTLALDHAEFAGETAKIHLTLERPGQGEIVTQALVTLTESFIAEERPFKKAEVYIHLAQRGIHTLTTNYRLAATR